MSIPRKHPKLMAIGDSLPQGCRSLTVKATYCAQSWPARVAQAQGWDFASPDHHDAVLFDLEDEIRRFSAWTISPDKLSFIGLPRRIRDNFRRWVKQPGGSKYECFDNLAIAGSQVHELYSLTSAQCASVVAEAEKETGNAFALAQKAHLPINGRFVLNPQQKPGYMDFSPLRWVEERQPETLLVHSGHNHGLFPFGFEARDQQSVTQGDHEGRDYYGQWQHVAERLAALPPSVKTILVVLLPKVGAVAELHPTSSQRANGYAPTYEPRLLPVARTLSGVRVAEVDGMIRQANHRIEKIVRDAADAQGNGGRVKFLDAYAALDALDYKNSLDAKRRLKLSGGIVIDNRFLDGRPDLPRFLKGILVAGGYQSIDGMHASGGGYADVASRALQALGLPHSDAERAKLLRRGFDEDPLLSNYPLALDSFLRLIDIARSAIHAGHFLPLGAVELGDLEVSRAAGAEEDTHVAFALPMLARAVSR